MILEFVGLPGTGKTTIASQLEESGIATRVQVRTKSQIFWWFFVGVVTWPRTFFQGALLVQKFRPKGYVWWNYFVVRYARLVKASWKPGGVWIVDEPPLLSVYSLQARQLSRCDLEYIHQRLPSIGHVIHFSLPESERIERLKMRGRGMAHEFDPNWITRLTQADQFICEALAGRSIGLVGIEISEAAIQDYINKHYA